MCFVSNLLDMHAIYAVIDVNSNYVPCCNLSVSVPPHHLLCVFVFIIICVLSFL